MFIRQALHGDEPYLTHFSRQCYDEMKFDEMGYKMEDPAALRNYTEGIDNPNKLILTAWRHGILCGMAVYICTNSSHYYDNHRVATEIVLHALPSLSSTTKLMIMNKLKSVSEQILKADGVKTIYINTDLRYPSVAKMFEKDGYRPFAVQMYKEV